MLALPMREPMHGPRLRSQCVECGGKGEARHAALAQPLELWGPRQIQAVSRMGRTRAGNLILL